MNTSDLTICPTLVPTAAAASTAVRAESGVSTIVQSSPDARRALRTRSREFGAAGLLTPRILGQIGAPRRQAARGSASAPSAASTSSSAATMAESNWEPAQCRSS